MNPLPVLLCALCLLLPAPALAGPSPEEREVTVGEGDAVTVEAYGAGGDVVVWLAPGYGFQDSHRRFAAAVARNGVSLWLVDLLDALFLTRTPDAYRGLDGALVADLLEAARAHGGGAVAVMAEEYAAIAALRGLRAWQQRLTGADPLVGAVLFNPALYAGVPALGEPPPYLPVTRATNVPVLVLQAGDTNNRWYLDGLLERLRSGGAAVYTELLPAVRSVFYFQEPNPAEVRARAALSRRMPAYLDRLARTGHGREPAPLPADGAPEATGLDHALAPYRGRVEPMAIALESASGEPYRVADYRGQVTVLNFWATWCPPCVEEIPSLNRLRAQMSGLPFELVSVNYGEDPEVIRAFMERVQVDFPVLVDPQGRVSAEWGVFTLPSTFVIGPDGSIAYGVNAAIPWDGPQVVEALKDLAPAEASP